MGRRLMSLAQEPTYRRRVVFAAAILLVFLMSLASMRIWLAEPISITSDSMSPSVLPGSHALILKTPGTARGLKSGDLVVFESPSDGELSLKRVIALGNQEVAIRDGRVYLDGVERIETDIDADAIDATYFGPIRVADDSVFVLGDNRGRAIDSRDYGDVPLESIRGRILLLWK